MIIILLLNRIWWVYYYGNSLVTKLSHSFPLTWSCSQAPASPQPPLAFSWPWEIYHIYIYILYKIMWKNSFQYTGGHERTSLRVCHLMVCPPNDLSPSIPHTLYIIGFSRWCVRFWACLKYRPIWAPWHVDCINSYITSLVITLDICQTCVTSITKVVRRSL